jgi:triosephosphate isomerase
MSRTSYALANWKLNLNKAEISHYLENFPLKEGRGRVGFAPQTPYLSFLSEFCQSKHFLLGSQDCSPYGKGAYTGEISTESVQDLGGNFCLIGHSERRIYQHESHDLLQSKVIKALETGLQVVFCIGEQLEEKEKGLTEQVLAKQIDRVLTPELLEQFHKNIILAYEPVWAIGTGLAATPEEANQTQGFCREQLAKTLPEAKNISILYGGSVKADNIEELYRQPEIDGCLVGGASLDPEHFAKICHAILLD